MSVPGNIFILVLLRRHMVFPVHDLMLFSSTTFPSVACRSGRRRRHQNNQGNLIRRWVSGRTVWDLSYLIALHCRVCPWTLTKCAVSFLFLSSFLDQPSTMTLTFNGWHIAAFFGYRSFNKCKTPLVWSALALFLDGLLVIPSLHFKTLFWPKHCKWWRHEPHHGFFFYKYYCDILWSINDWGFHRSKSIE